MSIRIDAGGFSLSVYNVLNGSLMQTEEIACKEPSLLPRMLEDALRRPRLQEFNFRNVELLADTPSTYVPLEYFRREETQPLYKLVFPSYDRSADEIRYQILPSLETTAIYSLPAGVADAVQSVYPSVEISCHEGCMLEDAFIAVRKAVQDEPALFAVIEEEKMLLCSFRSDMLHFASSYQAAVDADRLYYIMSVWKSLEMDEHRDTLLLCDASEELMAEARRFIKKVETCEL